MAVPFDYTVPFNPAANLLAGVNTGLTISNTQAAREQEAMQSGILQQNANLAREKFAAEQQAKSDFQTALRTRIFDNPNPTDRDYAEVMALAPAGQQDMVKAGWDKNTDQQKTSRLRNAGEVFALTVNGKADKAVERLRAMASGAKESGNASDAELFGNYADAVEESPKDAAKLMGIAISSLPGGNDILKSFYEGNKEAREMAEGERKAAEAPVDLATKEAKLSQEKSTADKLAVEARFAESKALADLGLTEAQTTKMLAEPDIAKENQRLKAVDQSLEKMRIGQQSEANRLRAEELQIKRDEIAANRDKLVREKTAEYKSQLSTADNTIVTLEQAINTPIDVIKAATGPVDQRLPTIRRSTADFEATVETLKSQVFMDQIKAFTGKGALSDAEGSKLQAAVRSLDLKQSPDRLLGNLREIKRLTEKGRTGLAERYGFDLPPVDRPDDSTPTTPPPASPTGGVSVEWIN